MLSLTPLSPFPLTLLPRSCANATSDSLFQQWLGVPHCPLFPAKGYSTTEQLCWVRVHRRWGCPGRVHATDEAVKIRKSCDTGQGSAVLKNRWLKEGKTKKKVHFFSPKCYVPSSFLTYACYASPLSSAPSHLPPPQLASPFSLPLNPILSYFCHIFVLLLP